ncbi:hypothetical protein JZ751_010813 [Albula glossodonta]|uniref:Uncharacterized protein n=1 Tax=Albula glossodonta TaxID=121402 RepID=A0A8T2NAR0_9TELE|nr:hypothetical protein JZ751_010813 [Albula glossodonta]
MSGEREGEEGREIQGMKKSVSPREGERERVGGTGERCRETERGGELRLGDQSQLLFCWLAAVTHEIWNVKTGEKREVLRWQREGGKERGRKKGRDRKREREGRGAEVETVAAVVEAVVCSTSNSISSSSSGSPILGTLVIAVALAAVVAVASVSVAVIAEAVALAAVLAVALAAVVAVASVSVAIIAEAVALVAVASVSVAVIAEAVALTAVVTVKSVSVAVIVEVVALASVVAVTSVSVAVIAEVVALASVVAVTSVSVAVIAEVVALASVVAVTSVSVAVIAEAVALVAVASVSVAVIAEVVALASVVAVTSVSVAVIAEAVALAAVASVSVAVIAEAVALAAVVAVASVVVIAVVGPESSSLTTTPHCCPQVQSPESSTLTTTPHHQSSDCSDRYSTLLALVLKLATVQRLYCHTLRPPAAAAYTVSRNLGQSTRTRPGTADSQEMEDQLSPANHLAMKPSIPSYKHNWVAQKVEVTPQVLPSPPQPSLPSCCPHHMLFTALHGLPLILRQRSANIVTTLYSWRGRGSWALQTAQHVGFRHACIQVCDSAGLERKPTYNYNSHNALESTGRGPPLDSPYSSLPLTQPMAALPAPAQVIKARVCLDLGSSDGLGSETAVKKARVSHSVSGRLSIPLR